MIWVGWNSSWFWPQLAPVEAFAKRDHRRRAVRDAIDGLVA
jgi:hypothetical protein